MRVEPPCAAFPPRGRRDCSYLVSRSPRWALKRDTARMAASTQASRIIREPLLEYFLQGGVRTVSRPPKVQAAAVVGSIIFFIAVILVAGKPLISACLRMIASSFARYTQKVLLSAT